MINPPPPKSEIGTIGQTYKTVQRAASKVERRISRERDLVIAVLFLVAGFIMGRI